jgi:hypothetical protein
MAAGAAYHGCAWLHSGPYESKETLRTVAFTQPRRHLSVRVQFDTTNLLLPSTRSSVSDVRLALEERSRRAAVWVEASIRVRRDRHTTPIAMQ